MTLRVIFFGALLAVETLTLAGVQPGSARGAAVGGHAFSLSVFEAKTPLVDSRVIVTRGTYPQVSRPGVDLVAVNTVLRRAVLDDERRFVAKMRPVDPRTAPGLYQTSPRRRLISASSIVVSALIPTVALFPAGNDGDGWLSVTVQVATGRRVGIADLFGDPSKGLKALASAVRKRLTAVNMCVKGSILGDPTMSFARGFAPTIDHYKHFALTPGGLAIGYPLGQVSGPMCGRIEFTLPYSIVRDYFSPLGQELVQGVRRPK